MEGWRKIVMQLCALSVAQCAAAGLLPAGPLKKSAERAIGIVMLVCAAEGVFSLPLSL